MVRATLELLTLQDAGLEVPDKPLGDFSHFPPWQQRLGEKESPYWARVLAPLTPSKFRGRLDVVEGVQVDDIDHGAHHPRVVL